MTYLKNFILVVMASIGAITARCIQMAFMIDNKTGFAYDDMSVFSTLITVFVILLCVFIGVFVFLDKQSEISPIPKRSVYFAVVNIALGISMVLEPLFYSVFFTNVPAFLSIIRMVLIIASGIVFIYFGVTYLIGTLPKFGFLVIPILLWITRLMCTFISYTVMSNITDNFYDIAMLVFTLLFLMYHGKLLCNIRVNGGTKPMILFGWIGVIISLSAIIPRLILSFLGVAEFPHYTIDSEITCIIMTVYIASYLINITKSEKSK